MGLYMICSKLREISIKNEIFVHIYRCLLNNEHFHGSKLGVSLGKISDEMNECTFSTYYIF